MKWYLEMMEVARLSRQFRSSEQSKNLYNQANAAASCLDLNDFAEFAAKYDRETFINTPGDVLDALADAQPFVCAREFNPCDLNNLSFQDEEFSKFDGPFKNFTFEMIDGQDLFDHGDINVLTRLGDKFSKLLGEKLLDLAGMASKFLDLPLRDVKPTSPVVLFSEVSPREYRAYSLTYVNSANPRLCELPVSQCNKVIPEILKMLNSTSLAVHHEKTKIKIRTSKGKEKRPVGRVIYIMPKTKRKEVSLPSGIKLDYSHRFLVRGHWRKIRDTALGKNRAGEYCVPGHTWVTEFEKGSKDKDLVTKVRVIKEVGVCQDT